MFSGATSLVERRAEGDVLAAVHLEHRGHPFGVGVELALPQNLARVLVERPHRAVGVGADEDQPAGGDHGTVAMDALRVAGVLDAFRRQRPHAAKRRPPLDGALVQVVGDDLAPTAALMAGRPFFARSIDPSGPV